MHIFHKWSKWEQYTETGTYYFSGLLAPKEVRGTSQPYSETRQRRTCEICGKMQDIIVSND